MVADKTSLGRISDFLIPHHTCVYVSKLSKAIILDRIAKKTEPEKFFRFSGWLSNNNSKGYEGVVGNDTFKIANISKRRNSNAPIVLGAVSVSNQNTKVSLRFRMNYVILILVPVWIFIVGSTYFNGVIADSYFNMEDLSSWFPLLVLVGLYVFITASFHNQVKKIKKELEVLIEPMNDADSGASWIIRN